MRSVCPVAAGSRSRPRRHAARGSGFLPRRALEDEVPLPGKGTVGTACPLPGAERADGLGRRRRAPLRLLDVLSPPGPPPLRPRRAAGSRSCCPPAAELPGSFPSSRRCGSRTAPTSRYWLVRHAEADRPPPGPALIYGYGGWNIAWGLPAYLAGWSLRRGRRSARLPASARRRRARRAPVARRPARAQAAPFDDLYAVAEALSPTGVTRRPAGPRRREQRRASRRRGRDAAARPLPRRRRRSSRSRPDAVPPRPVRRPNCDRVRRPGIRTRRGPAAYSRTTTSARASATPRRWSSPATTTCDAPPGRAEARRASAGGERLRPPDSAARPRARRPPEPTGARRRNGSAS